MYDSSTKIADFLAATAARQATPGGGSVAALAGAMAAAAGEMAVNYSLGKKTPADREARLKPWLAELTRARQLMLALMVEDQAAYAVLSELQKLPGGDPRRESFDAALLACIRVPQMMAATAAAMVDLCDQMTETVNPFLLSDLAVCADLAMATVRCALHNVRVNLAEVQDPADRASMEKEVRDVQAHALAAIQRAMPRIYERLGAVVE